MSFLKKLFGGSKTLTVHEKVARVLQLRKSQGWDGAFVKGETALIISLAQSGESPEDIAGATCRSDWPSLVAKFRESPEYLKVMGVR
jgi:hypothetical protein